MTSGTGRVRSLLAATSARFNASTEDWVNQHARKDIRRSYHKLELIWEPQLDMQQYVQGLFDTLASQ